MSQKLPNPNHIHVVRMYTRQHPLISLIYNEVLEEYIQIIHFHRIFHEINYPAIRVPPLEETFSSSSRPGAQGSQGAKGVFFTSRQPEDGRLSLGISGTFPKENRPGDWTSEKKTETRCFSLGIWWIWYQRWLKNVEHCSQMLETTNQPWVLHVWNDTNILGTKAVLASKSLVHPTNCLSNSRKLQILHGPL